MPASRSKRSKSEEINLCDDCGIFIEIGERWCKECEELSEVPGGITAPPTSMIGVSSEFEKEIKQIAKNLNVIAKCFGVKVIENETLDSLIERVAKEARKKLPVEKKKGNPSDFMKELKKI